MILSVNQKNYDLKITHLNFQLKDLDEFDLIIYSGKRGTKILKSKYFKSGKIIG